MMIAEGRAPTVIAGVPIDHLTMATCLDEIDRLVGDGRSSGRTHQVATVNVDFLVNAMRQPDVKTLLQNSSLNLADGMPLVWGAPLVGSSLPERVAGADLVPLLAEQSGKRGWRVHLFGGDEGVAHRARKLLVERHPDAILTSDPGPKISNPSQVDDEVIDDIRRVDPDILCVALGNPKQERFIAAHRDRLGCPVMVGIGGSLDMLVGDKRRAPRWVQSVGAEWIVRAAQEPARLGGRYLGDARSFVPLLARARRTSKKYQEGPSAHLRLAPGGLVEMTVRHADHRRSNETYAQIVGALESWTSVEVDFGDAGSIDSIGHDTLIGVLRMARSVGVPVNLGSRRTALDQCLSDFGTLEFIDEEDHSCKPDTPDNLSTRTLGSTR